MIEVERRPFRPRLRLSSSNLFFHRFVGRCRDLARRRSVSPIPWNGRALNTRRLGNFNDQSAGRNKRCDFGISKLTKESKDVAIDRLAPEALPRAEITGYQ